MKNNNLIRRAFALILTVALTVSLSLSAFAEEDPSVKENADFETFLEQQWTDTIQSDYLTLHFFVKNWREEGYEKPELTLGGVQASDYEEAVEENTDVLNQLREFNRELLTDANKAAYDTLEDYLDTSIIMNKYPQFEEMFNPYSGVLSNLITNFTEFVFRCEEDVQDYLVLLADFDRLIDDMIAVTEDQAANGYFMVDSALEEQLTEMQDFLDKGDENPLIVIFRNNLDKLGLSEDKVNDYVKQNNRIVQDEIFPAYKRAMKALEPLKGSRSTELGICGYEGGAEYYEAVMRHNTATSMDIEEMLTLLDTCITNCITYYQNKRESGSQVSEVHFSDAEEILSYLSTHMDGFPEGPDVGYEVSYLDPSVATPSVNAYYLNTPVDDYTENVIRVNGENVTELTDLYMTLSHEGYPGHLYQTTYYLASDEANPLMYITGALGYDEGWAMYAEGRMIYNSGLDNNSAIYYDVNEFYSYAYSSEIDLGINGLGWTLENLREFLDPDGTYYTDEDLQDTFDYFASIPGTILSYGVGDAMMMTLRARAQMSLGGKFDDVEFNTVLLQNGSRLFSDVEEDVKAYVNSKGYEYQDTYYAYAKESGAALRPVEMETEEPEPEESSIKIYVEIACFLLVIVASALMYKKNKQKKAVQITSDISQPKSETESSNSDNNPYLS